MKLNIQCVPLGPTRSISIVGMSWLSQSQFPNRPSLAICYETGKFQIMRSENDDGKHLVYKTYVRTVHIECLTVKQYGVCEK